jgi:ribosomal peptide maturation radical SAM protein 1
MPWAAPDTPSIQVGLLTALAADAGLPVVAHSLHLEAAGFFARWDVELADFEAIVHRGWAVGLGEWIFGGARRDGPGDTEAYLGHLRAADLPDEMIAVAVRMRELVPAFLDHVAEEVLATDPAVVGFTTTFSQTVPSLAFAELLKLRRPGLVVVFGGANCDGTLGVALHRAFEVVDIVVQGEAEPVFAALCADILSGTTPQPRPGVLTRSEGRDGGPLPRPALADVPTPIYDEYFERLAASPVRGALVPRARLVVETSRGCWWGERNHCTFCGLNGSSMTFRSKPAPKVLEEVSALARRYRRAEFDVVDNILDPTFFDDVLPELAARRRSGFDYRFFYETKANLAPHQVRMLRDAGVHRIQPGIESLSTRILRRMDKGVTALQNVRLLVFAARYDLLVTWNIIYGIPGETEDDYAAMAELVPSLVHLKPPGLVRLQVHRFSPYFDDPAAYGLRLVGPAGYYHHLYALPAEQLTDLAYVFDHEYSDGHDPERAVAPLRRALETWDSTWSPGRRQSLRYERGPGYLRIRDRRVTTPPRDLLLDDLEADLYLACSTGTTPTAASRHLASARGVTLHPEEVRRFFDEMTASRLLFREGDWYLALALPLTPDADPPPLPRPRWKLSVAAAS